MVLVHIWPLIKYMIKCIDGCSIYTVYIVYMNCVRWENAVELIKFLKFSLKKNEVCLNEN
jgi:hypothetical protein